MSLPVDRWLGVCLTLLALAWLWLVRTYIPDIGGETEPGPQGFPLLLGFVLAALGLILMIRARTPHIARPDARPTEVIAPLTLREATAAGGTFALLILYAFLLDKIGFILGTPIVIALALFGLLRMRKWVPIVALAIGFTLGGWLLFDTLLATPLPRGTWMMWL